MSSHLEGHDKRTALNYLESPSSMISQNFINVPVVALNIVYSNASICMSNPPETSKFHSKNSSYPPLHIQCPANCPMQPRWPIQIYWPSEFGQPNLVENQSVFPDLCRMDQHWHQHWDLNLIPPPPSWITLNKSTTFPQSHFFSSLLLRGLRRWSLGCLQAPAVNDLCVAAVSSLEGNEGILSPNPYQALSSTSKYPVTNCVFMCKCVDIRGQLDF